MIYTFMNKNAELFDIEMDMGYVENISNIRHNNKHLLPLNIIPRGSSSVSKRDFSNWWSNRRIPASRNGINDTLWKLNNISLDELAERSLGLSLSDQYWIRPSEEISWDEVNFFTNEFSEDIGKLLVSGDWNDGSLISPDNTSDGVIRKRWKIIDGKRCLLKGSSDLFIQAQPFREVFASNIAKFLFDDSEVVSYTLKHYNDSVYSVCENFIDTNTEYVSFSAFLHSNKKPNNISVYNFCKSFYDKDSKFLDKLLLLDYIIMNEDRHFGNFGFIRDVNTGDILRPAPVFDSSSCLFHNSPRVSYDRLRSKPFYENFERQIDLVNASSYLNKIREIEYSYKDIFHGVFRDSFESIDRLDKISSAIGIQIQKILNRDGLLPMNLFS